MTFILVKQDKKQGNIWQHSFAYLLQQITAFHATLKKVIPFYGKKWR